MRLGYPDWRHEQASGPRTILDDCHRRALAQIIAAGPMPAVHGVLRWRIIDLTQWPWDEFSVSVTCHTLGRELRAMGYRKLSARSRHRGQKSDDGRIAELVEIGRRGNLRVT
jgi:hypothetical protein